MSPAADHFPLAYHHEAGRRSYARGLAIGGHEAESLGGKLILPEAFADDADRLA